MSRKFTKAVLATAAVLAAGVGLVPLSVSAGAGDVTLSPTSGTQATALQLSFATNKFCTGSGATSYRWHAFIADASVAPTSLTFTSVVVAPGGKFAARLKDTSASNIFNKFPSSSPVGLISGIPAIDMSSAADSLNAATGAAAFANGEYNIGIVCSLSGAVDGTNVFYEKITVSGLSGGNFNWVKGAKPAAPAAATPVGTTTNGGTITGTFTAVTADPAVTSYSVTATPSAGGAPVNGIVSGTSYSITGLTDYTNYDVAIKATNAVGDSTATTFTNVLVRPSQIGAPAVSGVDDIGKFTVNWTAPTLPGAAVLTGYDISVTPKTDGTAGTETITVAAPALTKVINAVTGTYSVTVKANVNAPFNDTATSSPAITVKSNAATLVYQDITVKRPAGALVMTQRCGVNATLPAYNGDAIIGQLPQINPVGTFADSMPTVPGTTNVFTSSDGTTNGTGIVVPQIGGASAGTAPWINSASQPAPGQPSTAWKTGSQVASTEFAQYPYPVDANGDASGVATYQTDCGINLGQAQFLRSGPQAGNFFFATGALNQITVVNASDVDNGWTVTANVKDFRKVGTTGAANAQNSFSGNLLSWNPKATYNSDATTVGAAYDMQTAAGSVTQPKLTTDTTGFAKADQLLGESNAGSSLGIAAFDARIRLLIPSTANSGTYTSYLTLSVNPKL